MRQPERPAARRETGVGEGVPRTSLRLRPPTPAAVLAPRAPPAGRPGASPRNPQARGGHPALRLRSERSAARPPRRPLPPGHRVVVSPPAAAAARRGARAPRTACLLRSAPGTRRARDADGRRSGSPSPADRRSPPRGPRRPAARGPAARGSVRFAFGGPRRLRPFRDRDRRADALLDAARDASRRSLRLEDRVRLPRRARGLRGEPSRIAGPGRAGARPARRPRHGDVRGPARAARAGEHERAPPSQRRRRGARRSAGAEPRRSARHAPHRRLRRRRGRLVRRGALRGAREDAARLALRDRRRPRGRTARISRRGCRTSPSTASVRTRSSRHCARDSTWRSSPSGCRRSRTRSIP